MLHTLASQPADFISRVVLITFENPLELSVHPSNQLVFREVGAAPTVVVVPFVVQTNLVLNASTEGGRAAAGEVGRGAVAGERASEVQHGGGTSSGEVGSAAELSRPQDYERGGKGRHGRGGNQRPIIAMFMGRPMASIDGARLKVVKMMHDCPPFHSSPFPQLTPPFHTLPHRWSR